MQIIDELEPAKRSVYTGALGWIGFDGSMDLNIVIRTFLARGRDVFFQTGGGIVADSEPEAEYEETLAKAKALMAALNTGFRIPSASRRTGFNIQDGGIDLR
jgi:para-aminobenzoate synthetase component 1